MTEQELIEQLADKEHASWARWQQYLHSKCLDTTAEYVHGEDKEKAQAITNLLSKFEGAIIVFPELVERWQRQVDTPYAQLSEREKQSDRDEVAHILPIIEEYAHSEPRNATPLETIDLRLHRIENTLAQARENPSMSLLDLSALTQTIARMDQQIRRLDTEVFATGISIGKDDTTERSRQTLLGRVDELSGMAALGPVDQSFFVE